MKSFSSSFLKIFVLLSSLSFATSSCGSDSSSGVDPKDWCDTVCEKTIECALGPTLEECRQECLLMAENLREDYLENYQECMETATCDQLQADNELCVAASKVYCTTDTAEYNRTACLKILECDGVENPTETQIEQCIQRQHGDGDLVGCFESRQVDDVISCIEQAQTCSPSPVATCVYDILGLELGTSSHQ